MNPLAKMRSPALLVALLIGLGGCATADFYPYETRDNVHAGKGGSRFTVEGIDVWFNGEPPRKYAILGYIEDRNSLGPDEQHKSLAPHVLKKAKEVGAQALIEVVTVTASSRPSSGMVIGGGTGGMGVGFGFGLPVNDRSVSVKYTVLKYLD